MFLTARGRVSQKFPPSSFRSPGSYHPALMFYPDTVTVQGASSGLGVSEAKSATSSVGDIVFVGASVGVMVGMSVGVLVGSGVSVGTGVSVGAGVSVGVSVGVLVGTGVDVLVGLTVLVGMGVDVGREGWLLGRRVGFPDSTNVG
jgi:hypothetical protein